MSSQAVAPAAVALARRPRSAHPAALISAAKRHPTIVVGGAVMLVLVLATVFAPLLAPADPLKTGFSTRVKPPAILGYDSAFLLGSDNLGRDILSRLLYGGRISLALAALAVVCSALLGVTLGLVSGYASGWIDDVVMRVVDVQLSFPVIMLAIAVIAVVGTSPTALVGVLVLA